MANDIIAVYNSYMKNNSLRDRFETILGERAGSYMTSVLNIVKANDALKECDVVSVWNAALCSAAMDLPLNAGLGYAYIIPYKDNKRGVTLANFQLGAKGYTQLALRSGQYKRINTTDVRKGEIKYRDRLSGGMEFEWIQDDAERAKAEIIGYVSYFKLETGFESVFYMSMEELVEHAKKYSKMYQNDLKCGSKKSQWSNPETLDGMCRKTVLKLNLSKYGILSIEMQKAVQADNSVIDEDGNSVYIDASYKEAPEKSAAALEAEKLTAEMTGAFIEETPEQAEKS